MKSLISVIIPIYNGEKYIDQLINSMLNQSIGFENIEVVLIDNKSQDNSLDMLKNYSNIYSNIIVIPLEKHYSTPGHSRNMGILEASADYVMFCDGDDLYCQDFCEKMYGNISKEEVDLVSSRYTVNVEGSETFLNNSFLDSFDSNIKLDNIKEFPEIIQTQANLTIWNKIYKKDFLLKNNINFVEDHWAEDFLFSLEVFIKARGIVLLTKYSGYLYTVLTDSQSHIQPPKEDYYNNGLLPLEKAEKLLTSNHMEVMPYLSEFIVSWVKIFLESNLSNNDLSEIYDSFVVWFKRYQIMTKLVNISLPFNILINIAIKIFSLNKTSIMLTNKIIKKVLN